MIREFKHTIKLEFPRNLNPNPAFVIFMQRSFSSISTLPLFISRISAELYNEA
jgi:hypothetical protein